MFKFISSATAFVIFATVASADDFSRRGNSYRPSAFSWTGFYVGAHAGHARGDAGWTLVNDQTTFVDFPTGGDGSHVTSHSIGGWIGGGQIGYQHQVGAWVFGAELSLSGGHVDGTSVSVFESKDDLYRTRIDRIFLGTVRLGYAWDRWLTYVKGGYASAVVKASIVDTTPGPLGGLNVGTWSSSERQNGWTVGTGLEYVLQSNVTVGLQYDYVNLGDENHSALGITSTGVQQLWVGNIDTGALHMVTARINYKF